MNTCMQKGCFQNEKKHIIGYLFLEVENDRTHDVMMEVRYDIDLDGKLYVKQDGIKA